jgi:hypothetical protein
MSDDDFNLDRFTAVPLKTFEQLALGASSGPDLRAPAVPGPIRRQPPDPLRRTARAPRTSRARSAGSSLHSPGATLFPQFIDEVHAGDTLYLALTIITALDRGNDGAETGTSAAR